jgi:Mg2+ and Co2+ transporter CorA
MELALVTLLEPGDTAYPFAIGLMILSAVMPFLSFKRRGWL